jgi:predicted nucleic acid-binding protein
LALILDSGGLIVALDPNQNDHEAFAQALTSHRGPLVISPFVVAELDYMLLRRYGKQDQLAFLDEVDRGAYLLEPFEAEDFARARKLLGDYDYLPPFGIADASNMVLAERYGTRDILTTDQRDFRRIEALDGGYFRILPYDL